MKRWLAALVTAAVVGCSGGPTARLEVARAPAPGPSAQRRVDIDRSSKVDMIIGPSMLCARVAGVVRCSMNEPGDELPSGTLLFDEPVTSVAIGSAECASTRGGEVLCRGSNRHGELGAGLRDELSGALVRALGISNARSVSVGNGHVCAILDDGHVSCWGRNDSGQTGSDTHYEPDVRELVRPSVVPFVSGVVKVVASDASTCVLTNERKVTCWGALAVGSGVGVDAPEGRRALEALTDVDDIGGDDGNYCVAVRGEVQCWGEVSASRDAPAPVKIPGLRDARRVGVGGGYACALTSDGRVWCWGKNDVGQLGRGEIGSSRVPVPVDVPPSIAIAVGYRMTCAVAESHDVFCWGLWPRPYDEKDPHGDHVPRAFRPVKVRVR